MIIVSASDTGAHFLPLETPEGDLQLGVLKLWPTRLMTSYNYLIGYSDTLHRVTVIYDAYPTEYSIQRHNKGPILTDIAK